MSFTYRGAAASTDEAVTQVFLEFSNGLPEPVTIVSVKVIQSAIPKIERGGLIINSGTVAPSWFGIDPPLNPEPGQTKAAVSAEDVEMTYVIGSVRWSRTGTSDPVRL